MLNRRLRNLFSLSIGADADDLAVFRAHQLKAIVEMTPMMMAVNITNALIVCFAFSNKSFYLGTYAWAGVVIIMSFIGLYSWYRSISHVFPKKISPRALKKVATNSTLLGLVWGALPMFAYPGGDTATKLTIICFVAGMMGGGCFALYVIPTAVVGFLFGLSSTFLVSLLISQGPADLGIGLLLTVYGMSLYIASINTARTFAESKISESKIEEQASIIGLLLKDFEEKASDWLWETDKHGKMVRGAQRFHQATGVDQEVIEHIATERQISELKKSTDVKSKGFSSFFRAIQCKAAFNEMELSVTNDSKEDVWFSLSGKPLLDADGIFTGFRGVASNITLEKQSMERIAYLAHHDALTGLVNRANFSRAIERCFENRRVSKGDRFAVLYLDLDGFKTVNDTKGHKIGDLLLAEVGARLKKALHDNDVVARLGGDEFAILLRYEVSTQLLSALAEKIIAAIAKPYEIDGHLVVIGVSIGIAVAPRDGNDVEGLLNSADLGLYRAKEEGKGTFRFFETKMDDVVRERRVLEQELRGALANDQFELHFQPLVSVIDNLTTGFEALIRWNHPVRGQVAPSEFISLAEKTGLICEIGDWVLMEACRTATTWPDYMTISVNLSPQQFQNRSIVSSTKHVLETTGLKPSRLELEITEGLFVDNTDEALLALKDLKALGVMTSLDDFGTGYSSLSYLLKFPFDKLKIDQSFTRSIENDKTARDILETIARLGKILNLSVTAEGVENADQAWFLSTMHCNQMQGFHFGRPIPSHEVSAFLLAEMARHLAKKQSLSEALQQGNAAYSI